MRAFVSFARSFVPRRSYRHSCSAARTSIFSQFPFRLRTPQFVDSGALSSTHSYFVNVNGRDESTRQLASPVASVRFAAFCATATVPDLRACTSSSHYRHFRSSSTLRRRSRFHWPPFASAFTSSRPFGECAATLHGPTETFVSQLSARPRDKQRAQTGMCAIVRFQRSLLSTSLALRFNFILQIYF